MSTRDLFRKSTAPFRAVPLASQPAPGENLSNLTFNRRQILKFLGASTALLILEPARAQALLPWRGGRPTLPLSLTPVRLPHPLPIYESKASFLATGLEIGIHLPPSAGAKLDVRTISKL